MDNFNFKKFLAEGKLHEAMSAQDTEDIAGMVADEFTKESADEGEYLRYSVGRVEGTGFELDTEATDMSSEDLDMRGVGEGWGGNFSVKATEDGLEVRNGEKGGLVATIDGMGNFKMLSADESRAEMGLEEGEMLDEGILDGIKDKIVAKVEKIKDKFSAEEIEKMKSAAERALGKSAEEFTMADFTMDNIKKVGKAINALNEEQINEEGLGDKIQGIGAGLGMASMFVGGNLAMGSVAGGIEGFIAGAIAFVLSLIVGGIVRSRNNEAQEAPKSNKMKKSELKEMIKAAMLAETSVEETLVDADQDMAEAILNALGGEAAFEAVVRAMSTDDAQTYLGAIMRDHDIEMGPVGDIPGFEGTMDALDALSIREEEEDVEDVEIDTEEEVDVDMDMGSETDGIDVKQDADTDLGGTVGDVQDNLEAALEAARELGDEKLEDQIGNTLTFFTRSHVVKEGDMLKDEAELELEEAKDEEVKENLNESTFPMWNKIK